MDSERTQRANELFNEALKREPGERAAYLAESYGNDDALLREVEALLVLQDQVRGLEFSENSATVTDAAEPISGSDSSGMPSLVFEIMGEGYDISAFVFCR